MLEIIVLAMALAPAVDPQAPPAAPRPGAGTPRTPLRMDHDEVKDFLHEIEEYVEVRRKARAELPTLKEDAEPEDVTAYAKQLTTNIAARRKGAKQGDVFEPKVAAAIRRICRDELARSAHERKVVLTEGNPTGDEERIGAPRVAVNAQYIPASPLSTVPPTLLMALPPLPEQVEYRFIGRSLILRDTVANLIIDFVPNAVP
jgi:hypothetical protein